MIRIRNLYISAGHNFYGRHGSPAGTHETIGVKAVECLAGRGLIGDRYLDYKPDYKGQITFFAWEVFNGLRQSLGLEDTDVSVARRNVVTEGIDLNKLINREFEIQGIVFHGVEECSPCHWMNHAFRHRQAKDRLKGQGGLRARIMTDGLLRVDHPSTRA